MNKYIAFILTKYQYNILIATLRKLNIPENNVFLIIAEKAKKQGVKGEGFYKTYLYQVSDNIKNWNNLKKEHVKIMNLIDFYPKGIFLRNFNTPIARFLMSSFDKSKVYLIEEGIPSYMKGNFLGLPIEKKELIKTLLSRFYFSKGNLRVFPLNKRKVIKVGLFKTMKPWLSVSFLQIDLKELYSKSNKKLKYEVIILDQPLWQVGLNDIDVLKLYEKVFKIIQTHFSFCKIGIKLHPSTSEKEIKFLLDKFNNFNIEIIDNNKNIEEMLYTGELSDVKLFIGFFSWSLCLIKNHLRNKRVIAIANSKLMKEYKDVYKIMKEFGIKIIK